METQPKALLRTIFPSERIVEDNVSVGIVHASGKGEYHLMMLASTKTFADGRLVALVSGARCGADGDHESEHGSSTVNVYTLRRRDGTWQVVERHEQVADEPVEGPCRDLVLDFTGRRYTVTTNGDEEGQDKVEHLQARLRESARYRFNGEGFVLVSGSTPLPGP